MVVDPSVLEALRAAVAGAPDNPHLRAHLAGALLDSGSAPEALDEARRAIELAPDHVEAITVAASAARAAGESDVADGYDLLLRALTSTVSAEPIGQPAEAVADGPMDEFDAFLIDVLADDARTRVTLADVGGLDDVKRRLHTSFLAPLRNPKLREMYGTSLRGGLLLYGPPGCGKTFLARAVAGELGAEFIAVGLHDVLDMWLGNSEKNLHGVFEHARRQAPCVVFFDEVDALGMKRSNLSQSAGRNVVAQLLGELDSVQSDNSGVFVLGATNAPWDLDPALRRPGRFDRTMLVLPPDEPARSAILAYHLRAKPAANVRVDRVAKRTDGYSGADLRLIVETAAELALTDSVASGDVREMREADLLDALKDVKPSTRAWFEVAKNFATFANQDGEYDELLGYMRAHRLA
jgi:SpoVK/Ycf46/Vps4 family AAA+-type ATPase